ncbi:Dyp-type peroxidase [Rathayibacter sp. VKM Ac-2856]|uniref:Dyp-type peroxidase n=1 Tax=unclassified Rathayibacter TaxID=2609250 RepID=UPI0015635AD5|nr:MULTISPECIES: Dyp-type peroxidase [unclassified Rathayibacter]NQX05943.1 Dyp-type peroxidase [Rathayibacter sp. VKM Ac-2858]NQX21107.1 Dyp-type peroxidase [Rathayibacter sp. VKM Ac-2856]
MTLEDRVPAEPQAVIAPLSRSAVFLSLDIVGGQDAADRVRDVVADVGGLIRAVGFRDLGTRLSCLIGIGSDAWDRFGDPARPQQLHPFREVVGATHTAVSTQTDLLVHIRAERDDACFELERLLLDALGEDVVVRDEVIGFRYFDNRDLLGFVDGTENPTGAALPRIALIGAEDEAFAGGSYLVAQKYLHDLTAWHSLSTEQQEHIIGRRKADAVEGADDPAQLSHRGLATVVDEGGTEHDILRDNMPFGRPGRGEFGTFFLGLAADLSVIEAMLTRMFVGVPAGRHDRLLDFSTATTGGVYFVPSRDVLEALGG